MLVSLLLGSMLAYLVWYIFCLEANVRTARALKVPVVRIPFDVNSNLWVVVQPLLWKILAHLPILWNSYPDFIRFSHRNWHFLEKSSPTVCYGPVWALVSPRGVHLHFSDPDAIQEIFSRWRDFVRPVKKYQLLAVYGPSIFTVELEDWPRHRKVVAGHFNQATMKFAWNESSRQTQAMLHYWNCQGKAGIPDMQEDLRTLSINVLAATAFLKPYDFIGSTDLRNRESSTESYRDCLHVVLKYAIFLMLVPYRFLTGAMLPHSLASIGRAAISLKGFMMNIITEESAALSKGKPVSGGLITSLVRALDQKTPQQPDPGDFIRETKRSGLSVDEILGNIFVINIAGHDTTANTLVFTMMLLAANPEVQGWLHEEIITVTQGKPIGDWDYALFEQLKRCQAVFLETLRLYAPITGLPKITSRGVQILHIGDRPLAIPPGTEIFPLLLGIQTDPSYWVDPYVWRPSRWILHPKDAPEVREELFVPQKGTFFPWSEGPQNCVGKKFSQVEAVAVLACLFRDHRVCIKTRAGETEEHAKRRAQDCVNDVNYQLLLKMNHPDRVKLECMKV